MSTGAREAPGRSCLETDFATPVDFCATSKLLAENEVLRRDPQLGMDYGAVNHTGKPSRSLAIEIVRKAIAHGVTTLDTARATILGSPPGWRRKSLWGAPAVPRSFKDLYCF